MLVTDTSALISLAVGSVLSETVAEFDLATTATVRSELTQTAEYDDRHGEAATTVLQHQDKIETIETGGEQFVTSRIDTGEASCVALTRAVETDFFVTDDFRALPEIEVVVEAEAVLSPFLVRALADRGVLSRATAQTAFDTIVEERDWIDAPIYRYAQTLFDGDD